MRHKKVNVYFYFDLQTPRQQLHRGSSPQFSSSRKLCIVSIKPVVRILIIRKTEVIFLVLNIINL